MTGARILRLCSWVAAGIVLLVLLLAGIGYNELFRGPSAPTTKRPANRAESNRQDLEYFRYVASFDRSFSSDARVSFNRAVDDLEAQASELTDAQLEMGMTRAMALADNGHTAVRETAWGSERLKVLPVIFGEFAEGLFIVKADPAYAELLGAQVLSIDGRTLETLTGKLLAYYGGPDNLRRELMVHLFRSPEALNAIGLSSSPTQSVLSVRLRDGSEVERTLPARKEHATADSSLWWPKRALSPVPLPDETLTWAHVLDGVKPLPLYLRNPNRKYWHEFVNRDGSTLLFMQVNKLLDQPPTPVKAYLQDLLTQIRARKPHDVVIDVRFCSGGNYQFAADFAQRLPGLLPPDGHTYVLTSSNTFSAALITTAILKYYGKQRTVIVGDPLGDREAFWAEGGQRAMPNSGIVVKYSTGYHDWENGCRDVSKCFWINLFLDVPAGKLTPAIRAPLRFSDYIAGKDSAMEAIFGHATEGRADAKARLIDDPIYQKPQRLVDIGGRKMNLYCSGAGSPVVVFDSGLADPTAVWGFIQPAIAQRTRACSYDRASIGYSEPGNRSGTSAHVVEDLHSLLSAAAVVPPYILVGHSFGGLNVRLYAYRFPKEVAGLVLVDPAYEDQASRYAEVLGKPDPAKQARVGRHRLCVDEAAGGLVAGTPAYNQCVDPITGEPNAHFGPQVNAAVAAVQMRQSFQQAQLSEDENLETISADQVRAARRPYGALPLWVLTHGEAVLAIPDRNLALRENLMAFVRWQMHAEIAALSTRGIHEAVVGSGHYIQLEHPEALIAIINDALALHASHH